MPTMQAIQNEIAAMLDVADEELTEEQKASMDVYLKMLGEQEAEKVDAFSAFVKEQEARSEYYKAEAKRLSQKAAVAERNINRLRQFYLDLMRHAGLKQISGNAYKIKIAVSKAVEVTDPDKLAEEFWRITVKREPNKVAIKDALKNGDVAGARLVENQSLRIG